VAETKPIPVRLDDVITQRLNAAASRIGNNRAGLIRMLVNTWLDDFEKRGVASLPPNWQEIIAGTDNRTRESRQTYPTPTPALVLNEPASSVPVDAEKVALEHAKVVARRIRAKRKAT